MGFRDRMKKKKNSLKKRHNKQARSGGRFPTIFNKKKLPDGIKFFKVKEGEQIIDILPWEAGKNLPFNDHNKPYTDEGEIEYVLDVHVHTNIGSMNQPFVCPYENFGEPCPICEDLKENRREKDEWSKLRAKRRSIYLIWDRASNETEKKGIQIFDSSHFFMEEKISEIAKLPRGGGFITFSDPDTGKHVAWTRKGTGAKDTQYLGHKFIDRDSKLPDKILDKTFALDSMVKMHPSYDEIEKAFKGMKLKKVKSDNNDAPFDEDIDDSSFGKKKKKKKRKRPVDRKKTSKTRTETKLKKKKKKRKR